MVRITGFRVGTGDQLVDLWCRSAPADPITADRFRDLVLLDPNFDPEGLRLAWDGAALVGAAYAVFRRVAMVGDDLEPHRGWVPFFFVDPAVRGRGIGARTLTSALDYLRANGREEAIFSAYTPNYVLPGLDAETYPSAATLLARFGFTTVTQAAAMDRGLVGYTIPADVRARQEALEAAGYSFGSPHRDEVVWLIKLADEEFSPDWARAIRENLATGLPLERIVVARDPDAEVVGWAMFGAYAGVLERFGPFGVLARQRGNGLGAVLLHLALTRMRALGAHSAWFLWTGEQSPAGALYRKAGFVTSRRFEVMSARLTGDTLGEGGAV